MSKFIISLSFGNYLKGDGGVDKAINEYQTLFNEKKIDYIHISPVVPNGNIKLFFEKNNIYTVLFNGEYLGFFDTNDIYNYINQLIESHNNCIGLHIHHTKKFRLNFILELINSLKVPVYFFLHDYYSICEQPNLLYNNYKFCGNTRKKDSRCNECIYGTTIEARIAFTLSIIHEAKEIYVVSPSKLTLDIWKKTFGFLNNKLNYLIVPHQQLVDKNSVYPNFENKIKIAFIGRYGENKGSKQWERFVNLVEKNNLPIDLYYLGFSDIPHNSVQKINVKVSKNNPNKMLETMKQSGINCAFMWSICPETYSYAYFEAYASNLFVITNKDSGNIAYLVEENGNGKVYDRIENFLNDASTQSLYDLYRDFVNKGLNGPLYFKSNPDITELCGNDLYISNNLKNGKRISITIKKIMEFFYLKKNRKQGINLW